MSWGAYSGSMERRGAPVNWDAVAGGLALLLVAPLLAVLYAALRTLGQAPIFAQDRVGYGEEIFTIFKFRTIPAQGWEAFAAGASPLRLALYRRLARLMRTTGLDELPQLWNVVRGDMRLIGPRPLTPEDYLALPDFRRLRCLGRPGITGLAQVNGGQALDPISKLILDIYQLENLDLRLGLRIALRSVGRILGLTSLVSVPCPVTLEKAKGSVARRLQHMDPDTYARLEADIFTGGPRLEGPVT